MDPNLLVSVIKSQAGTLSKAVLEGVMNSIDAGATRVDVTLTPEEFHISDNGRGFATEEDIKNWFGRFGTPHQEGDAIYGRFRMGRGQMMAFASTEWSSGPFRMTVDLENEGLGYTLEKLTAPVKGCHIVGKLYRQLSDYRLKDVLSELKQFVAYALQPVYVNGELFGAPASRLKSWTYEDDDAYYKVMADSPELLVYNQGVFVEAQGTWRTGLGGIIVSKLPLKVNFARNAVMEDNCEVWQRIMAKQERLVMHKLSVAKKLDENERRYLARRLAKIRYSKVVPPTSLKVLTDPTGKHWTLGDLPRFKRFVYIPESTALACTVQGENETFVVTDMLLSRFGVTSLNEFLRQMESYPGVLAENYEVLEESQLVQMGLGSAELVDEAGLSRKEIAAFRTLTWLNEQVSAQLELGGYGSGCRKVEVGSHKSGRYVAWTDGATCITVSKKHLRLLAKGLNGVSEWLLTLVHEYMHDTDDSESHSHGEVFYRKFHDAVFAAGGLSLGRLAQEGLAEYLRQLSLAGVSRPRELTRELKGTAH